MLLWEPCVIWRNPVSAVVLKSWPWPPRSSPRNAAVTASFQIRCSSLNVFISLILFSTQLQMVVQMWSRRMFLMVSERLFRNSHSDAFVPPKSPFVLGVWRTLSASRHVFAADAETWVRSCGRFANADTLTCGWTTQGCKFTQTQLLLFIMIAKVFSSATANWWIPAVTFSVVVICCLFFLFCFITPLTWTYPHTRVDWHPVVKVLARFLAQKYIK